MANDLRILEQLQPSTWNELVNNELQNQRVNKLIVLEKTDLTKLTLDEWELHKKAIRDLQKELNAFEKDSIKPIKQTLLFAKDKIIGEYEKQTTGRIKELKKHTDEEFNSKYNPIQEVVVEVPETPLKTPNLSAIPVCLNCGSHNIGTEPEEFF